MKQAFASGGTAEILLLGACESFYKENIEAKQLEELMSQILVTGCDRDILSGWGGVVYTL